MAEFSLVPELGLIMAFAISDDVFDWSTGVQFCEDVAPRMPAKNILKNIKNLYKYIHFKV